VRFEFPPGTQQQFAARAALATALQRLTGELKRPGDLGPAARDRDRAPSIAASREPGAAMVALRKRTSAPQYKEPALKE
jgi:hypothetical protein